MDAANRTALIGIVAFALGAATVILLRSGQSHVLALEEHHMEAALPPMVCRIDQHDSMDRHLPDEAQKRAIPTVRTLDDENALVFLHGRMTHVIRFTTYGFKLKEFGCRKL